MWLIVYGTAFIVTTTAVIVAGVLIITDWIKNDTPAKH